MQCKFIAVLYSCTEIDVKLLNCCIKSSHSRKMRLGSFADICNVENKTVIAMLEKLFYWSG